MASSRVQMLNTRPPWWKINRPLLSVKGFYFFFIAGIGSLLPFLSIYMKQLGLSASETGIIYGVMPFVGFLVRPLIGALADKLQAHKLVLMVCCLLTGVFYLCLLLVPTKPEIITSHIRTNIKCNRFDSYIDDCEREGCPFSFAYFVNRTIDNQTSVSCSAECKSAVPEMLNTRICFTSKSEYPANCKHVWVNSQDSPYVAIDFSHVYDIVTHEIVDKSQSSHLSIASCSKYHSYVLKNVTHDGQLYWKMVCSSELTLNCDMKCDYVLDSGCQTEIGYYQETFWIFFAVFLLANVAFAPILSLNDSIAYSILGEKHKIWGRQRMWGSIGFAIFAISATLAMDSLSKQNYTINYNVSFYIFGVLMLFSVGVAGLLNVTAELVSTQMLKNIGKLLSHVNVLAFLVAIFILGMYNGVIEGFLFWFLLDLQEKNGQVESKQIILGLSLLCNVIGEVPMFFVAGKIIKKTSHLGAIYIAFLGFALRFLCYSFLTNAWYVLFVEPLHGVTLGLLLAAATSYASIIAPLGMSATIQGLVGGIYFGFGKGIGSFLTGFLYENFGEVWTFRVYCISAVVFVLLYLLLQRVFLRHAPQQLPVDDSMSPNKKQGDSIESSAGVSLLNHPNNDNVDDVVDVNADDVIAADGDISKKGDLENVC